MTKKALLVGINYINSDLQLSGCLNDAKSIYFMLRNKFGFEQANMAGLLEKDATRKGIISGMKWLVHGAKPGDVLFISYSGHGSQVKDVNGDEADGLDESIIPYDWTMKGEIIDDEIHAIFSTLPKGVQVVAVFDSCHSGTIMDLRFNVKNVFNPKPDVFTLEEKIDKLEGDVAASIVCFSGCMDNQTSADTFEDNLSRGAMTWAFMKALDSHPNPSGAKLSELLFLMRALMKKHGYQQTASLSSSFPLTNDQVLIL
jgi:metacaspase-1